MSKSFLRSADNLSFLNNDQIVLLHSEIDHEATNLLSEEEKKYIVVVSETFDVNGNLKIIQNKVHKDNKKYWDKFYNIKVTNFDKIKSMNVEELAKFLVFFKSSEYFTPISNLNHYFESVNEVYKNILNDVIDWIKEEVK